MCAMISCLRSRGNLRPSIYCNKFSWSLGQKKKKSTELSQLGSNQNTYLISIACGKNQKALQGKTVLSNYSETIGLLQTFEWGNPKEFRN